MSGAWGNPFARGNPAEPVGMANLGPDAEVPFDGNYDGLGRTLDQEETTKGGPLTTELSGKSVALMVAVPWVEFLILMLCFTFGYRHAKGWAWVFAALFVLGSALLMQQKTFKGGHPRYALYLGIACFTATALAVILGLSNYYGNMQAWNVYKESRHYENVLPNESPIAKKDAGKINFSVDTRLDPTRAVGFQSGKLFCVAPIVNDATTNRVGYWAAGTDCCRRRGRFDCDDAWNENTRSGLVLMDSSPEFQMAAKQAAAAYDLQLPEKDEVTFVRWVGNMPQVHDDMFYSGRKFFLLSVWLYFLFTAVAGLALFMHMQRKARKH